MSHDHAPYREDEPDRLPGESRTAYRCRVDPRYKAYKTGRKRTSADQRLELWRTGQITEEEYDRRAAQADAVYDALAAEMDSPVRVCPSTPQP